MVHWFDIFVTVLLLISAAWSYYRGFVREIFSLLSLVAGYIIASMFSSGLAPYAEFAVQHEKYQEIISFVFLFIISAIIINVIGVYTRRALHLSEALGVADHIAGTGMGLAKGALILALIVYPLALFPGLQKDFTEGSKAAPELVDASGYILGALAPGFAKRIEEANKKSKIKSFKKRMKNAAEYRKKIEKIKTEIKNQTDSIKSKLGIEEPNGKPSDDNSADEITDSERQELDKLIEKLD